MFFLAKLQTAGSKYMADKRLKILVCGGAGYIGSHTCVALGQLGHEVVVFDNLSNSTRVAIDRMAELVGHPVAFIQGDIRERRDLARAFAGGVDCVIHFAALKSVGESCSRPLAYFDNNISGTITLLQAMEAAQVSRMVFSSSATVYGNSEQVPVTESAPLQVTNPYGRTKLIMEDLIRDYSASRPDFSGVLLRYFNPVGAHPSGRIGESPTGTPANLMPYVTQVAVKRREQLQVFGSDYPTRDGTGVRDYVHVVDLAEAHASAVHWAMTQQGCIALNLGTGCGYSVLELIRTFERVSGAQVPYRIVERRPGDVAELWADVSMAREILGWQARHGLERMCEDAWRWQLNNPDGYQVA